MRFRMVVPVAVLALAPQVTAEKIYWAERQTYSEATIWRANRDGSNVEALVTDLEDVAALAMDMGDEKMYWTQVNGVVIRRANLDGSQIETLVELPSNVHPFGLALCLPYGKMYWGELIMAGQPTRTSSGRIRRANLDGTQIEDIVTSDLMGVPVLALDIQNGKLYWADDGTRKIQRSNLDGSDVEDLVTAGLMVPHGLALDVAAGKMYWSDAIVPDHSVRRANLDGSQVEDVLTGLTSPRGVALDVQAQRIYWADYYTGIHRAHLDGSGFETLVDGGRDGPFSIALDLTPQIPAVSNTALTAMTVLLLCVGAYVLVKRRPQAAA